MKVSISLILSTLVGSVAGGIPLPGVTVGMNIGEGASNSNLGGLEPKVTWQTAGNVVGFDVEGGIDVDITGVDEAPSTSFWGKLKKSFTDIGDVSIRGDVDSKDSDSVDLDIRANGFGTAVQLLGRFDAKTKTAEVSKVQLSKDIDTLGGTLSVNPLYNLKSSTGDVRLGYTLDNTKFMVDAEQRRLTVSHSFGKDTVTPSVSASGDFSLSYSRNLPLGKLTTSWAPNDAIKLIWTDGEWQTTIKAPIEGYYNANNGIKVNMKRTIGVF